MPKVSLVVCLYKERDLLERLLEHSVGCFDDLVVVHDGPEEAVSALETTDNGQQSTDYPGSRDTRTPLISHPPSGISYHCIPRYESGWKSPEELSLKEPDAPPIEIARDYAELPPDGPIPSGYRLKTGQPAPGSIHELVEAYGGRFYEGPRCFQQEPHWPFAWWAAKHDWLLRLDADEFPSTQFKQWLLNFTLGDTLETPGFLLKWPLWDGSHEIWKNTYPNRVALFMKHRVSMFGMVEQSPMPKAGCFQPLDYLLHHQPHRKSFGLANLLLREQAYRWRRVISSSLMLQPKCLPVWQYSSDHWSSHWEVMLSNPLAFGIKSLLRSPIRQAIDAIKQGSEFRLDAFLGTGMHQFLMAATIFAKRKYHR